MPLTREQRQLISKIGNARRWAGTTRAQRSAATQAARDALDRKYLDAVEPDLGIEDEAERDRDHRRRAKLLREADLAAARLKASTSRSKAAS
jgi:hypothetical protein